MIPFFVGSKGGKCAAFSFSTPIQTFPWGKALSFRAEAPRGRVVRGVFCSGGGVLWGSFCVRCCGRPLAGASRLGDVCCLYLCGCNGSDLRDLVPLRRLVRRVRVIVRG